MFSNLGEKLQNVFKKLRAKGKLTEADVKEAMREVRLALLEADVNFKIVKDFIAQVSERALGKDILEGLNAGQQVIKITHEQLINMMGKTESKLTFASKSPSVFMLVGLQGAGKTTTCGKIAGLLRKQGKRSLLAACDVYRPAAVKQLEIVGKTFDIPVFSLPSETNPVSIAKAALEHALKNSFDLLIIDTAGRLHIDDALMQELIDMKKIVNPQEILLVIDATTGQDAVNVATTFNSLIGIDGVIATKLDGDTRGGAVLSVAAVTGKPIKYIGMGEKLDEMESFHPDRMASRILGMGDVLTLIEKAEAAFDEKSARALEEKLRKDSIDLEDFLEQLNALKKMGSFKDILGMIPGIGSKMANAEIDENATKWAEAIIQSMTKKERQNPNILNSSRKKRIANGSGRTIQEVNRLLKQFEEMRVMMKQFTGGGSKNKKRRAAQNAFAKNMSGFPPFA